MQSMFYPWFEIIYEYIFLFENNYYLSFFIPYLQTLNCRPIASVDHLNPEMLGTADLVEEFSTGAGKVIKVN